MAILKRIRKPLTIFVITALMQTIFLIVFVELSLSSNVGCDIVLNIYSLSCILTSKISLQVFCACMSYLLFGLCISIRGFLENRVLIEERHRLGFSDRPISTTGASKERIRTIFLWPNELYRALWKMNKSWDSYQAVHYRYEVTSLDLYDLDRRVSLFRLGFLESAYDEMGLVVISFLAAVFVFGTSVFYFVLLYSNVFHH